MRARGPAPSPAPSSPSAPSPVCGLPRPRRTAGPVTRALPLLPPPPPRCSILLSRRQSRPLPPASSHAAPARRRHARGGSRRAERAAGARGDGADPSAAEAASALPRSPRRPPGELSPRPGSGGGGRALCHRSARPGRLSGRGAGAHRPGGDGLGARAAVLSRLLSALFLPRRPRAVTPTPRAASPGAWRGPGGLAGWAVSRGRRSTDRQAYGRELLLGPGARCLGAPPTVGGSRSRAEFRVETALCRSQERRWQRLAFLYYLLTVFASGPTKAAGPGAGAGSA